VKGQNSIRVAIHIDVTPGVAGGTAQSTQGLVSSLGQLDGPETYILSARSNEQAAWISQHCGPNQRVVVRRRARRTAHMFARARTVKATLKPALEALRSAIDRLTPQRPRLDLSDGYYESLGVDVLHFPTQPFILCALPTIYNPHDLQHLHYPQFWTAEELARREVVYRGACHFARTVVVGSAWIKQDVVRQYQIDPDKVQIIPWAPPTVQYPAIDIERLSEARSRLALPASYALYPAVTWPHKNHPRLFEAMADLRDRRGVLVHLVCTGSRWPEYWPMIERRLKELRLESQVRFLGFLSEADLRAVYQLAQFLIMPTLFEADSCPIHEAWSEGLPVASSNHTALPDQVADAGLLFDAKDVSAIANALERMSTDAGLRRQLVERGYRRVKDFDWIRTAKAYRAVYRGAAGLRLGDEDRWLLSWDWMREPQRAPHHQLTS
jgi:glycosyltransferase involved in cell wall biosynthesis